MWTVDRLFANKKPNFKALTDFGFCKNAERYTYSALIAGGMLSLDINITQKGEISFKLFDLDTDDEYTLIHSDGAVGTFVGNVRSECENIFSYISKNCFDNDIFKSHDAKSIILYMKESFNIKAEHLWDDSPNNAIFRDKKSNKWFAVIQTVNIGKLGVDGDCTVEILNLKDTPENVAMLINTKGYFPAFHMNKKHWFTIILNGSIPIDRIFSHINTSYNLVVK